MRFERSFNFCGRASKWLTTRASPRKRPFGESVAPAPVEYRGVLAPTLRAGSVRVSNISKLLPPRRPRPGRSRRSRACSCPVAHGPSSNRCEQAVGAVANSQSDFWTSTGISYPRPLHGMLRVFGLRCSSTAPAPPQYGEKDRELRRGLNRRSEVGACGRDDECHEVKQRVRNTGATFLHGRSCSRA